MKLLSIPVLTLGLTVLAQGGSVFTFSALPPSVSTGDSFVVTVSVTPGPTDQVNAFSVDLIYSNFLTVDLLSTPTELGYFLANGVYFSGGNPGAISTPGYLQLVGISDALAQGDYLPGADQLFEIAFTANGNGTPELILGPGSFLVAPDGSSIDLSTQAGTATPEPSSWIPGVSGLAAIAAMRRARRRS